MSQECFGDAAEDQPPNTGVAVRAHDNHVDLRLRREALKASRNRVRCVFGFQQLCLAFETGRLNALPRAVEHAARVAEHLVAMTHRI